MATVLDTITAALKEIGVLSSGETPAADDAADALAALNRLLDQWAAERLQIFTVTRTTWAIVSGTQDYAVGPTATVARPGSLDHVNFMDTSTSPDTEYPMTPLTEDAYASIGMKALTGTFPASWYYNPTFPNGTLSLFPVPTSTTLTGVMYAPQAVGVFTSLVTVISLPPGYSEMIITNLAVALATPYSRQVDPSLRDRADKAKAIVKRGNIRLMDLNFPAGSLISGGGAWSIRLGP